MSGGTLPTTRTMLPAGLAATGALGPLGLWAVVGALLLLAGFVLVRTGYLARTEA